MIERIGESLEFRAQYIASKLGATGLTVTVDLWGPAHTEIVTGGSATEMGDGLYYYVLSSGSVTAAGLYTIVFKTASASVDQQHLAANFTIGADWVENLDAAISSRSTVTTAQVNAEADQALADYDPPTNTELNTAVTTITADTNAILVDTDVTIPALIAGLNDLTAAEVNAEVDTALSDYDGPTKAEMDAAIDALGANPITVINAVTGNDVTVYVADTWEFTIPGLGSLTDYEVIGLIVKKKAADSDDDAILYVRSDAAGLVRLNKAAGTPGDGTVTIGAGEIAVKVAMQATAGVTFTGGFTFWIKVYDTSPAPDEGVTIATGEFTINRAGLQAVV